ncbi:hypothetical protein Pst134EA_031591 [Puccinia striiformis f. sp. tritici]|uniref:uncharacterized protein n=1 Tax=Puccinia striiformis f. sp. tritici TaxID=168172 RepID=UPI00200818AD|nr:uncharacterized protein Pst134EA_031591 [Puccinia striiformis f. sp. tritici]KAH9442743.1 hypothetical protein Pst134EA_031591 [Puccinia striiformis f. sp. tritici]
MRVKNHRNPIPTKVKKNQNLSLMTVKKKRMKVKMKRIMDRSTGKYSTGIPMLTGERLEQQLESRATSSCKQENS